MERTSGPGSQHRAEMPQWTHVWVFGGTRAGWSKGEGSCPGAGVGGDKAERMGLAECVGDDASGAITFLVLSL